MASKKDELIGRRVICPDNVKGTIKSHAQGMIGVSRDDDRVNAYLLDAVKLIEPRTHTLNTDGGTRVGQLVAEYLSLADAADRFEKLKKEIKEALPDATGDLGVAWEDGDAVEVVTPAGGVRAYPMTRTSVDIERMKREYPEGYKYFLTQTRTVALKLLT